MDAKQEKRYNELKAKEAKEGLSQLEQDELSFLSFSRVQEAKDKINDALAKIKAGKDKK